MQPRCWRCGCRRVACGTRCGSARAHRWTVGTYRRVRRRDSRVRAPWSCAALRTSYPPLPTSSTSWSVQVASLAHIETVPAFAPARVRQAREDLAASLKGATDDLNDAQQALDEVGPQPDPGPERASHGKALKAARKQVEARTAELNAVTKVAKEFEAWVAAREHGMFWRLAERIGARVETSSAREKAARLEAVVSGGTDSAEPRRARRRFVVTGWVVVLLTTLAVTLVWTSENLAGLERRGIWTSLALLVGVLAMLLAVRSWYTSVHGYMASFQRASRTRARGAQAFALSNADRRRFEAAAKLAESWALVLSWVFHAPWSAGDEERIPSGIALDPDDIPSALAVAEPVLDEHQALRAARLAAQEITGEGWRSRALQQLANASLGDSGADDQAALQSTERLDSDDGRGPGYLDRFLKDLEAGTPQRQVWALTLEEAAEFLRENRFGVEAFSVRALRSAGDHQNSMGDAEFLVEALAPASTLAQETWSPEALVGGAHERLTAHYWSDHVPTRRIADRDVGRGLGAESLQGSALLDVAVRVDVSQWLDATSVRLFGRAAADPAVHRESSTVDDSIFS